MHRGKESRTRQPETEAGQRRDCSLVGRETLSSLQLEERQQVWPQYAGTQKEGGGSRGSGLSPSLHLTVVTDIISWVKGRRLCKSFNWDNGNANALEEFVGKSAQWGICGPELGLRPRLTAGGQAPAMLLFRRHRAGGRLSSSHSCLQRANERAGQGKSR